MYLNRFACGLASVAALALFVPAPAGAADANAATDFGALPAVTNVSLSPDGTKLAFIAPLKGDSNDLFVVDIDAGTDAAPRRVLRASGDPETLLWCRWANDARIVCQIGGVEKVNGDIHGFRSVIALDAAGGKVTSLSVRRGQNAVGYDMRGGGVIDWLPADPDNVLMIRSYVPEARVGSLISKDADGMGVDRVDVNSGAAKTVEKADRDAVEFITDGRGNVRLRGAQPVVGQTYDVSSTIRYHFRPAVGGAWRPLANYDLITRDGFNPYVVDAASDRALGLEKINGRTALVALALDGTGNRETLFAHPEVDVDGIVRVGRDQRVIGATYVTDRRQLATTDAKVKAMEASLSRALGGKEVHFVDASTDEAHWLVWAGSDTDAGRYYRYSPAAKQLRPLLEERPQLAARTLAEQKPIKFPAGDGTMIPAYLTLPPGKADARGLPAIVMPHGGPGARDEWGFDWLSQYFAAQGYAVVQPNFRGSSGYGESWFQNNGFQSWRVAVGDVNDAGRWLVAQGADPEKLSIVGWSYGGYAALQSGVLAPSLFKSIVAIAPITDLAAMKEESRRWVGGAIRRDFIGSGPHVREGSPARNAPAIAAPVLMFHGTLDQNVDIEQARIMQRELKSAGRHSELVEYDGLRHNLGDAAARADMLRRISDFLPK